MHRALNVLVANFGEQVSYALVLLDERLELCNVLLVKFDLALHVLQICTEPFKLELATLFSTVGLRGQLLKAFGHVSSLPLVNLLDLSILVAND